jgi:16S rRNA (guanine966-N2)-methyltransferase
MRIIAGQRRGMKLLSPKTSDTRPITDRVKESLFNVLQNYGSIKGKYVADLFCGTGSLGLEALSRGAKLAFFVDYNPRVITSLKKNIEKAGFTNSSEVVKADMFKVGISETNLKRKYDIIFIDPPYECTQDVQSDSLLGKLLTQLSKYTKRDGIVLVRTRRSTVLTELYKRLKKLDRREWGTTAVTFLGFRNDK